MFYTLQAVNKLINKLNVSGGLFYQEKKGWTYWLNDFESKWTTFMVLLFSFLFLVFHGHFDLKTLQNLNFFPPLKKQQQHIGLEE